MKTRCECMELSFVKRMAQARRYNITDIKELLNGRRPPALQPGQKVQPSPTRLLKSPAS
jgi:hypothetical protein